MYRNPGLVRIAALSALLLMGASGAAEAQSLGRLGRAVKDKVGSAAQGAAAGQGGSGAQADSEAQARNVGGSGAGLTADQLERLAAGLAVEVERRSSLAAELAALEPRPNYEQCKLEFSMSADGQRALTVYTDVVTAYYADPQNAKKQEAMQAAQRTFEETMQKACGPSPDDAARLRKQRQAEPERAGAERAGVTGVTYARLKEVVLPFCAAADRFEAGSEAKIPSGAGRSFSYSAEDTALLKPRCGQLLPLLQATL